MRIEQIVSLLFYCHSFIYIPIWGQLPMVLDLGSPLLIPQPDDEDDDDNDDMTTITGRMYIHNALHIHQKCSR